MADGSSDIPCCRVLCVWTSGLARIAFPHGNGPSGWSLFYCCSIGSLRAGGTMGPSRRPIGVLICGPMRLDTMSICRPCSIMAFALIRSLSTRPSAKPRATRSTERRIGSSRSIPMAWRSCSCRSSSLRSWCPDRGPRMASRRCTAGRSKRPVSFTGWPVCACSGGVFGAGGH
jgi:hypothetical protein